MNTPTFGGIWFAWWFGDRVGFCLFVCGAAWIQAFLFSFSFSLSSTRCSRGKDIGLSAGDDQLFSQHRSSPFRLTALEVCSAVSFSQHSDALHELKSNPLVRGERLDTSGAGTSSDWSRKAGHGLAISTSGARHSQQ
jgi:hypothetical protein